MSPVHVWHKRWWVWLWTSGCNHQVSAAKKVRGNIILVNFNFCWFKICLFAVFAAVANFEKLECSSPKDPCIAPSPEQSYPSSLSSNYQTSKHQTMAARSKHNSLQPGECRVPPGRCRPFRSARTVSGFLENISLRLFFPLFQLLLIFIISFTEGLLFLWKTSQTSRPPSKTLFTPSLSLYSFPFRSFHSFFCHIGFHLGDRLISDYHQIDDLTN